MQLKKQARKANKPGNPVRTHVVRCKDFNPVVPQNIEIIHASFEGGRHVVVTSQPRPTL